MKRYLTSTSSSDSNPSFVSFFIVLLLYHHNPLLANERNRKEVVGITFQSELFIASISIVM